MNRDANVVEEYVELQRSQRWRPAPPQRLELVRKSYAQQLARAASVPVSNRRERAETKASIYNHLLPLLEMHADEQTELRSYYQKLLLGTGGGLFATLSVLTIFLLI